MVVVAASTGGGSALGELFGALSRGQGPLFLVAAPTALHDPLALVLTGAGHHVTRADALDALRPDTVVLASERIALDGTRLVPGRDEAPIDGLFGSLARCFGPRGIAVVLSGGDGDGSRGAIEVHDAGGLVLVQSPATARIDLRPRSVIATGKVDAVLPPGAIASTIDARAGTLSRGEEIAPLQSADPIHGERFLRVITDNLPGTVSYWDRDGRCRFANQQYLPWFGLDPAAMIGHPIRELLGEELYAGSEPYILGALAGVPQRYERTAAKEDGRACHLLAHYVPHVVEDEVIGFFAIVTDISEQRAVERELVELNRTLEQRVNDRTAERDALARKMTEAQKLESLGVLAGGIAHDFNNRLTSILAAASLLGEDPAAPESAREAAELIAESSRRAAELCRQLLAYSGRGSFVLDTGDISELVDRTTELIRSSVSGRVSVQLDLARDLPPVAMDPDQIRQVVMNLVVNAAEAVGPSGGTVWLRTGRMPLAPASGGLGGSECVFLEVGDTGCGIATVDLERIFEPFFTTRFAGRGLGLSAVQGIVRGHGGAVTVRSAPGEGSLFRVLLPVARPSEHGSPEPPPVAWRGAGVVLVADDEPSVRRVSERVLARLGFEVEFARDGLEAVQRFCITPDRYTLVVMDLTMPRMSGAEALVAIRRLRPEARVLVMSGYAHDDPTATFSEQRPNAFLSKPFELRTMIAAVREALGEF